MKKFFKRVIKGLLAIVVLLVIVVSVRMIKDRGIDYDVPLGNTLVPTFRQVSLDFEQRLDDSKSIPFTASAIIDIDNDGVEELYIGGGPNQQDVFMRYTDDGFVDVSSETGFNKTDIADATLGSSAIDVDNNGYTDLIVSRTSSVWLYKNTNGKFVGKNLNLKLSEDTSPISVAIADINRDGHFDLYVAGYIKKEYVEGQNIFNKEGYGGQSALFLNRGDDTFEDITKSSGLFYDHNTFMGIFIDIDNDNLEDLVVAHDTGHVKTWKNLGNNKFEEMSNPNTEEYSYPMGIAVTDYGNDGDADFFFSNVGTTPPRFLVKGDLRDDQKINFKWIMFENNGGFSFSDIAEKSKLADYEFSWGAIFEDFNLDGRDDLVVSENYIGFPGHKAPFLRSPGRFLVQTESGEFSEIGEQAGVVNKRYSIAPITADFNGDGYPDVVHINIAGKPQAFINNGGDANYLKVKLPNIISSIAAKVTVTKADGSVVRQTFISGEGLCSDQSHILIFGLGNSAAKRVDVEYINGLSDSQSGTFKNQMLTFAEAKPEPIPEQEQELGELEDNGSQPVVEDNNSEA
jgi:hypothetical protein